MESRRSVDICLRFARSFDVLRVPCHNPQPPEVREEREQTLRFSGKALYGGIIEALDSLLSTCRRNSYRFRAAVVVAAAAAAATSVAFVRCQDGDTAYTNSYLIEWYRSSSSSCDDGETLVSVTIRRQRKGKMETTSERYAPTECIADISKTTEEDHKNDDDSGNSPHDDESATIPRTDGRTDGPKDVRCLSGQRRCVSVGNRGGLRRKENKEHNEHTSKQRLAQTHTHARTHAPTNEYCTRSLADIKAVEHRHRDSGARFPN